MLLLLKLNGLFVFQFVLTFVILHFSFSVPPIDKWPLIRTPKDCPQQENGYDCGVFSTQFGRYISEGRSLPIQFEQQNMIYFRHLMAQEIFKAEQDKTYPDKLRAKYWAKK